MSRCFLIVLLFRAILKAYRWMTNNFSSLIRSALAGPFIGIVSRIHTFPRDLPTPEEGLTHLSGIFPRMSFCSSLPLELRIPALLPASIKRQEDPRRVICFSIHGCRRPAIVCPHPRMSFRGVKQRMIPQWLCLAVPCHSEDAEKPGCCFSVFLECTPDAAPVSVMETTIFCGGGRMLAFPRNDVTVPQNK